jgi:hypothetical protein
MISLYGLELESRWSSNSVAQSQPMVIPDGEDMHVVASLFKRYFREMKVPLIPFAHYAPLLQRMIFIILQVRFHLYFQLHICCLKDLRM